MNKTLSHMIPVIITWCWDRAFSHSPSAQTLRHAEKFFVFGAGMVVAQLLSLVSQVLMGRHFGPEVYGQITIILLISSYCATPIVGGWGLVFTKIAAREHDEIKKNQALKSLLLVTSLCGVSTMLFLFLLQRPLAALLEMNSQLMQLSLVMTLFYAWWSTSKQIAQGFQDWSAYTLIQSIWAVLVLAGISGLILSSTANLATVCSLFFAGYFLSGLIVLKRIPAALSVKITREYVYDILSHGRFLLLNGLVGVATFNIDRILIHTHLGAKEVGIYQAHFFSTYGILSAFMTILMTYIFPLFCKHNNMQAVLGKIILVQYPLTIFFSLIIGGLILRMYAFPVSPLLFGCLCLFNAVQLHVQLKTWHLAGQGAAESKTALQANVIFLLLNVIVLTTMVGSLGIIAGGFSLVIAAGGSLAYLIRKSEYRISL